MGVSAVHCNFACSPLDPSVLLVSGVTEKARLQLQDLEREAEKYKQLHQAEHSFSTGVSMLERLYEKKLALEVARNAAERKEFQNTNMKLANELWQMREMYQAHMNVMEANLQREKEVCRGRQSMSWMSTNGAHRRCC